MALYMRAQRGDDITAIERQVMPTFAELVERADAEWWPSRGGERHHQTQRNRLNRWWLPHLGRRRVDTITAGDVAGVLSRARSAGRKLTTCNRILSAGSTVLEFAVKLKLISSNPVKNSGLWTKEPKRRREVLSAAEVLQLVQACPPDWQPLIGLMGLAGLRHGEAVGLRGEDVDLQTRQITVRRSGASTDATKNKQDRQVPIGPELLAILEAVDLRRGEAVSRWTDCRYRLTKAAEAIGTELHVHPHLLRHSFGTALGQAGVGQAIIQRIMGHTDPSTTQGYVHVDAELAHVDVFGGEDDN